MKKVIIIFSLWLLVVNTFALLTLNRFNLKPDTAYNWINPDEFSQEKSWDIVSLHSRWDSSWYLDIAKNGYVFKGPDQLSNVNFFPLYPLLIRWAGFIFGNNLALVSWVLSIIFLFLAILYFAKLVKEFHSEINSKLPIILLLIFPTAFFLNAVYAESLFLFLSVASFYYALKRKFLLSGFFGFLASLTRIFGLMLFIPLIWEYFKNNKLNLKILPLFLVPLGTTSFFLYYYFKFGDFFLYIKSQIWFGRTLAPNREHFLLFSNPATANFFLDLVFVIFAIIVAYFVFKRLRASYGIYMLSVLAIALGTGTFMSIGRYILVLFPIFILGASLKNQYLKHSWILISILLFSMNIILFVNNYWAG